MDLAADCRIAHPRPLVFASYRDRLTDLVPYLPNIRAIEVLSRSDEAGKVRMHNVWHGGGEIPAAARAVIRESMLSWDDHALWDEAAWTCDWRIETRAFTKAVRCEGTNRYSVVDGGTMLQIRGALEIDARHVTGVPKMLAARVGKLVESFLAERIRPNLVEVAKGLELMLTREGGSLEA